MPFPNLRSVSRSALVVGLAAIALMTGAVQARGQEPESGSEAPTHSFVSRPDLEPRRLVVDTSDGPAGDAYLFTAPGGRAGNNLVIYGKDGDPVWVMPVDDRSYLQKTEWDGADALAYYVIDPAAPEPPLRGRNGEWVILDASYDEVARVRAGNGYYADLHDVVITPARTALILIYAGVEADLGGFGGPTDAIVTETVIQEIDLSDGTVVFEWHSLGPNGIPLADTYVDLTQAEVDYFHANALDVDTDGNILVSARNTSSIVKLDRTTGDVIWRLGGKSNDFGFTDGDAGPSFPHDVRRRSDGSLSIYDNGNIRIPPYSRGIAWTLDETNMVAEPVHEWRHTPDVYTPTMGSAVEIPDGTTLVNWSNEGIVEQFGADGASVFEAHFADDAASTYRAHLESWTGTPDEKPAIGLVQGMVSSRVFASFNGSTETQRWDLLAGPDSKMLTRVDTTAREGFETGLDFREGLDSAAAFGAHTFVVRSKDKAGTVLGTSAKATDAPDSLSAWAGLGGGLASGPAVASWGPGRLDVFVRGTDDALYHKWFREASGWSRWEHLGGTLTSAPTVASWGEGRLDVFVRGADSALYHRWYRLGVGWSKWERLGGSLASAPAAAAWGDGRLDVFARGADDGLIHEWYRAGTGWVNRWENLGGKLTTAPGVAAWGEGRLDVVARSETNSLIHLRFATAEPGSGWSVWSDLGGTLKAAPAVTSQGQGRLDVFVRGVRNRMYHTFFEDDAWQWWESLGREITSAPAAAPSAPGTLDMFSRSADLSLQQRTYSRR